MHGLYVYDCNRVGYGGYTCQGSLSLPASAIFLPYLARPGSNLYLRADMSLEMRHWKDRLHWVAERTCASLPQAWST